MVLVSRVISLAPSFKLGLARLGRNKNCKRNGEAKAPAALFLAAPSLTHPLHPHHSPLYIQPATLLVALLRSIHAFAVVAIQTLSRASSLFF
jgi:hypothetical protein